MKACARALNLPKVAHFVNEALVLQPTQCPYDDKCLSALQSLAQAKAVQALAVAR